MRILGIDPGSRKSGWAIIEVQGRKISYVASGVLHFDKTPVFLERLSLIYSKSEEVLKKYEPDHIAIESLIYVKNVTSLAKLAQARGAMIAAFTKTHLGKVFEYSPNLVKTSVTGHGHATKENVDKALGMIFGKKEYKTHDESDALAIALCHSLIGSNGRRQMTKASSRSLKSLAR